MSRKIFYMIRHGESLLNAAHIRQGADGSLSEKGRAQAAATGERLKQTRFDAVLVSPFQRTRETAEIIVSHLKPHWGHRPPVEYVDLLTERRNPKEIINQSADDPAVAHIVDLIDKSYHDDEYRFSDEENFGDLKDRARALLDYLAKRREKKLLVVTHSIFLKMVAAYIAHWDQLDAKKYNLLSFTNASNNASITVCEYRGGWLGSGAVGRFFFPLEKRWRLIAWDDYTR